MKNKVLIIAEAGVNHNGDLEIARELVEIAAKAGANYIKFQTFKADRQVTLDAKKASYQEKIIKNGETQHEMLRRLELSLEMHQELILHCSKWGIGFLSTAFDIESIDLLLGLGQTFFKVPSGEITNKPYLRYLGSLRKPIILSTGMATMAEVGAAIKVLETEGADRKHLTLLHCTTEYPTPMDDVNLSAMVTMQNEFKVSVGYSDHTMGIEIPIAAVALGASIIEKHFTLDRQMEGPDHKASLEPNELKNMVIAIRNIESAMGDGVKKPALGEIQNQIAARKSLVASREIRAGEQFNPGNMVAKRPGSGISPMRWDEVIGKLAPRDFQVNELIEL